MTTDQPTSNMNEEATSPLERLNTTYLMASSALALGLLGFGTMLFPQEVLGYFGAQSVESAIVPIKLAGALYVGFALLNWMARHTLIGGIYSRPVAIGNFTHFLAGSVVLVKQLAATPTSGLLGLGAVYGLLALGFGVVAFGGGGRCG